MSVYVSTSSEKEVTGVTERKNQVLQVTRLFNAQTHTLSGSTENVWETTV